MEKILQVQLGINIYTTYSKLIEELQHSIITAIDKIKESITNKGEKLKIVVVSNANDLWIQQHLHYAEGKNSAKYPILSMSSIPPHFPSFYIPSNIHTLYDICTKKGKYVSENNIDLISAKLEAYSFLQQTMSKQKAMGIVKSATDGHNKKKNRWILKYLSFASIILNYKREFKMDCTRVFSFGDGIDEGTAIYEYANELKIPCIHFDFVSNPTIEQLRDQWNYTADNFNKLIDAEEMNDGNYFHQYRVSKLFEKDNNPFFTGNYKQLKTICHCFEMWQSLVQLFFLSLFFLFLSVFYE